MRRRRTVDDWTTPDYPSVAAAQDAKRTAAKVERCCLCNGEINGKGLARALANERAAVLDFQQFDLPTQRALQRVQRVQRWHMSRLIDWAAAQTVPLLEACGRIA